MTEPGTVTSCVRRKFKLGSLSACLENPGPDKPSFRIGTLGALKFMVKGGSVPGGICLSIVCAAAVTWAFAVSRREPGCRKILVIDWPF